LPRPPKGDPAARERAALSINPVLHGELEKAGPFNFIYERYSLWSYAAMEFARASNTPGLLEVNAPLIEEQAQYRVLVDRAGAERVANRVFDAATALLPVSSEVAAYLERFPGAQGKVNVVPNGVRPERFPEGLEAGRDRDNGMRTDGQKPYPADSPHGLCLPCERRQEDGEGKSDEEPDGATPHGGLLPSAPCMLWARST